MESREMAIMDLEEKLLSIAGTKMAGQEGFMEDRLVSDGRVMENYDVTVRPMISNSCHYNSAQLIIDHDKKDMRGELQMWTGWGLNDGTWREHSWVVAESETELFPFESEDGIQEREIVPSGTVIETTTEREIYYGVPVTGSEFDEIAYMHGAF